MYATFKVILFSLLLFPWYNSAQFQEAKALPQYELELTILPAQQMLEAEVLIKIDSSFVQNGNIELFHNSDAEVKLLEANPPAEITVEKLNEAMNKISLQLPDLKKAEVAVRMNYTLTIPANHPVNRITEEWIELNIDSFWLPLINSNGFPAFNYKMKLHLDPSFTVVTGDSMKEVQEANYKVIVNKLPRLDISFAAAKKFYGIEGDFVEVAAIHPNTKIDSVTILADQAMTFLNEYIAQPNDFKEKRKVIISPREETGYSRKNYIVLSDIQNQNAVTLAGFLCHEFSHYWFSEADASSKHHWLSESFAEYLSMIFIREKYGEVAFEKLLEDKKKRIENDKKVLAAYEGRPSHLALYFKGPLILHQFEQYIGKENFKLFMNAFVDKSITTNEQLFNLVETLFGKEAVLELKKLRDRI